MKTPKSKTGGPDGRKTDTAAAGPTTGPAKGTGTPSGAPEAAAPEIRKIPAHSGVVDSTPVEPGRPAQAGQPGSVTPAESTLVGQGGGAPAASPKTPPKGSAAAGRPATGTPETAATRIPASSPASAAAASAAATTSSVPPSKTTGGGSGSTGGGAGNGSGGSRPTPAPARKSGFWPVALGGAVAAGLGAAATIYALPHLPEGWVAQDTPAAVTQEMPDREELIAAAEEAGRLAALDALPEDLTPRIEALEQQAAALAEAPAQDVAVEEAPAQADPAPAEPAEDPATAADAPAEGTETADAAPAEDATPADDAQPEADGQDAPAPDTAAEEAQPQDDAAPAIDPALLADLQQRLEEQQAGLEEQRARLEDQQARLDELAARPSFDPEQVQQTQERIETAAAEAQASLDAARTEAQQLQDAAAEGTRRAEAVAAIAALQTALDEGVTPEEARAALEGAGIDTPEALQAEVPSLTELQTDFPEAARAALRASLRETSASGEGNLLTNFLRAQTGARSVEPREGDDPDAVLSRADAEVQAGRIDAALAEVQTLSEPALAAPVMADWLSRATAYSQARAALTDLSSGTN
ncbi:hypothetical protein E4L95_17235 [Paracoccus liaowanqingii]|uniref:Uncharacterized protein n=1 Tax=Paracoccus liaowanqingii TaxID=2560053 RepID=A0A4Z1BI35_9RHOB|nr:hypothetical protein [Paracoccus liaowanqingii]TGN50821.1 hypothetical protein E4L95_17235 [Paracoccus liaowanqingii]